MGRIAVNALIALGLAASAPGPGVAEGLVDAADPDAIAEAVRGLGPASLTRDQFGDPLIEAEAEGIRFRVEFYGCSEGRDCMALMFAAGWAAEEPEAERLADWNRERRFGKAYLDDEGMPTVEMDVSFVGGVSRANLDDMLSRWRDIILDFIDFNDF